MNFKFLTSVLLGLVVLGVANDQASWITLESAQKAGKLIKERGEIAHYCEPCGNTACKTETVDYVRAVKAGKQYYQIQVNGKDVDLAYVYVLIKDGGRKFENVALKLNISVEGVTDLLECLEASHKAPEPDYSSPNVINF